MTKREIISLLLLLLVIFYGMFNYFNRSYRDTRMNQDLLDTVVIISAKSQSKNVATEIDSVFAYIKSFEQKFNDYDPSSWITKLNSANGQPYPMDSDAYEMLKIAQKLYQMTDGSFDVSIKPLYDLWGFSTISSSLSDSLMSAPPDSIKIKQTLTRIGFSKIKYDQRSITMPADMQITFGAIAKGYALDKARSYMQEHNFISGQIDCTSSMTFFGQKMAQVVSIQHPRPSEQQQTIGSFRIKNNSISTSGDYQLYFDYEGRRYHHILSPQTGYPVENVYSVTVINPSAAWADGLSTALFLLNPLKALDALKQFPGSNAVVFYQDKGGIVALKSLGMKDLDWHEGQ